jgi:hypothetical protein
MSYKWPDKDPDETVDYSVDWSRFLGTDTITSATWFVKDASGNKEEVSNTEIVNGLQFVSGTITSTVATARFGLGTNNIRYTITCRINTTGGLQYERSIFLRIREK